MKQIFTFFVLIISLNLSAQTIGDFENFNLDPNSFLNNASPDTVFQTGNLLFPNAYFADYDYWTGWSVSNMNDMTTAGLPNQFSVFNNSGATSTSTFGIAAAFSPVEISLTADAAGQPVEGLYINNATYAYLSMKEGDDFAKRFGGEDGTDPDYFLLSIRGMLDGEMTGMEIPFYLADFRSDNSEEDYIVSDWTYVDLTSLGNVDKLVFELSSTDNNAFGMLTPATFCIDQITTTDVVTSTETLENGTLKIYPNPVNDFLNINWESDTPTPYRITNITGKLMARGIVTNGNNQITTNTFAKGSYIIQVGDFVQPLIKID